MLKPIVVKPIDLEELDRIIRELYELPPPTKEELADIRKTMARHKAENDSLSHTG